MPETLLQLRDAAFGYRGRAVVSHVDLDIQAGQFLGLSGPNGSGKTTLFRGILGLIPPLSGTVSRNTGDIGYVPQREELDPVFPLTVEELVQMGAYGRLRGLRRLSLNERDFALQCLSEVGLLEQRSKKFAALSGGQRQRALIARALMVRPRLILLDEPTSGVDQESARQILALLSRLVSEDQHSVLMVAHQLDILRRATEQILWVADGGVVQGIPKEIVQSSQEELSNAGNP